MLLSTFPVIMETVRTAALCTSKSNTISSELSCTIGRDINDISKEKEEELLYGTGDDGDEEDALSDDSIRLRLSDDDDDTDRNDTSTIGIINNQRINLQTERMDLKSDTRVVPASEQETSLYQQTSAIEKNTITSENLEQEEQMPGNVSVDDRTMSERHFSGTDEKDTMRIGNGQWIRYNSPSARPMYKGQWRFSNSSSRSRPFHNRPSYPRHNFRKDDQHYQNNMHISNNSDSYKNRYYNNFSHYGRGRGNTRGNYNPYFREHYNRDNKQNAPERWEKRYKTRSFSQLKSLDAVKGIQSKKSLVNGVQVSQAEEIKNPLNDSHDVKATSSSTIVRNEQHAETASKSVIKVEGHDEDYDALDKSNSVNSGTKLEIITNNLIEININSQNECVSEMSNSCKDNELTSDHSDEENNMSKDSSISQVTVKQCSEMYDDVERLALNEGEVGVENVDASNMDLSDKCIKLEIKEELEELQDASTDDTAVTDKSVVDFSSNVSQEEKIDVKEECLDKPIVKSDDNYETVEVSEAQQQLRDTEDKSSIEDFNVCNINELETTDRVEITSNVVVDAENQDSTLKVDVCKESKEDVLDSERQSDETAVTLQSEHRHDNCDENEKDIEGTDEGITANMQISCNDEKITASLEENSTNEIESLVETCSDEREITDVDNVSHEESRRGNSETIVNESDRDISEKDQDRCSSIDFETRSSEPTENSENGVVVISDEQNQQGTKETNSEDHLNTCEKTNVIEIIEDNIDVNSLQNDALQEESEGLDETTISTENIILHDVHNDETHLEKDQSSCTNIDSKIELSPQSGGLVSDCNDSVVSQSETLPSIESNESANAMRKQKLTMSEYELLLSKEASDEHHNDQKDAAALQEETSDATESIKSDTNETVQTNNTVSIEKMNNAQNVKDTRCLTVIENSDVNEHLVSTDVTTSTVECETAKLSADDGSINIDSDRENSSSPVIIGKRKRQLETSSITVEENEQGKENMRQKRRATTDSEDTVGNKLLNDDSDLESSDNSEHFVTLKNILNKDACSLSSSTLKRNSVDTELIIPHVDSKKMKISPECQESTEKSELDQENHESITSLNYIRKLFQRDAKEKLVKLTQEELEELLIQKIVETITMRGEIGRLREQARICDRNQEATRFRCQQLSKQVKDFEMVLTRNAADRRTNNDKPVAPIKINRSVGLQVNFMSEHGMQSLKQVQQNTLSKTVTVVNAYTPTYDSASNVANTRRGIKTRSPRKSETPVTAAAIPTTQVQSQSHSQISSATPAALVITKPVESVHALTTLPNQTNNAQQSLPKVNNTPITPAQQTIAVNGKVPNQSNRQVSLLNVPKGKKTNDLIDLTDEEEKVKSVVTTTTVATPTIVAATTTVASKQQPRYQRVIQTIPGNVAITTQSAIRVVQPASQPTPTALVNNMNAPRLTYLVQNGPGSTRQLLVTSNPNQIRPVTSNTRTTFPTLTYKTGISTLANGTVRMLTTPANSTQQICKHPAPLPDTPGYTVSSVLKCPPPAPSLKISKVAHGIVLSWNMTLSDKYAEIASYQLYAYQEVAGVPPNTTLWKKVGDVRALPLPMACTLTQFSEGNNYHFAVRAVDTHSRLGKYSAPGNISL